MFCSNCGNNVADNANFCNKCGAKIITDISSSGNADEIVNNLKKSIEDNTLEKNINVKVAVQGISADLKSANGSYDAVEIGFLNQKQFVDFLQKVKNIKPLMVDDTKGDYCPASIIVEVGDEIYNFEISGGSIIFSNTNNVVSVEQAVEIVSGEKLITKAKTVDEKGNIRSSSATWGSDHKDVKGLVPVRKKGIPPTDRVKTESSTINTRNSPQISDKVIKSSKSKNVFVAPIMFSILAFVLSLGGFAVDEIGLGVISMVVAIVLIFVAIALKGSSRTEIRLGFDWNTNTIWVVNTDKKISYLGNANCITKFSLNKTQLVSSRYQNVGSSSVRINTIVKDKYFIWELMVEKTDGSNIPLCKFYNEQDALRVLNKASHILTMQNDR